MSSNDLKNIVHVNNFDIIGDIHGHADALIRLLTKMGYVKDPHGIYAHPQRMPVFLGDFIDRGSEQAHVINIVKPMVETGKALAVMGNHEFNAICYHTYHPLTNEPLRAQNEKNKKQHHAFLKEYPLAGDDTETVINWFKTLPLFIELDEFRAIHACWNEDALTLIAPYLNPNNTMNHDLLIKASSPDNEEFHAIETLLKGMEIPLPEGHLFHDKDGNPRTNIRVKWWAKDAATYKDYALVQPSALDNIPDTVLPETMSSPEYTDEKPVFFGHYWFSGDPRILKDNVACLDYSAGNKEKLVCYQWHQGDTKLSDNNFVVVDA